MYCKTTHAIRFNLWFMQYTLCKWFNLFKIAQDYKMKLLHLWVEKKTHRDKKVPCTIKNEVSRDYALSHVVTEFFVLRFYGPVNPMGSCRARSIYLTTRLLVRLSPLSG